MACRFAFWLYISLVFRLVWAYLPFSPFFLTKPTSILLVRPIPTNRNSMILVSTPPSFATVIHDGKLKVATTPFLGLSTSGWLEYQLVAWKL
ncbi:hypothetical protein MtrunA17_Chr4g0033771 [Medicago truncatula]|uniref:Transmembrane protein, putative n=1 Tax=Medicago truncatula TaxID=3880 RepID=G7JEV3_MEDTR|nr:transmembrane protein, putative [Medicago truncatula]RHN61174.1 hypothetical protein MtrunA17_Chr4g0033771 [Medicago truncatula]